MPSWTRTAISIASGGGVGLAPAMNDVVSLRPLAVSDAPEMVDVLSSPRLYVFTGGEPPDEAELRRRYAVQTRGCSTDGSQRWLNLIVALEPGGQAIGYVQATIPQSSGPTEIAWVIGEPWQGRGYARTAAELLADELRRMGVVDVVAHIHPEHVASQRVATHLAMSPTGVVVDGETRWEGSLSCADKQ